MPHLFYILIAFVYNLLFFGFQAIYCVDMQAYSFVKGKLAQALKNMVHQINQS
jgi:hypothetical protein